MVKVAEYRSPRTPQAPAPPRPWNTHGAVTLTVAVLSLAGALVYAGPSATNVLLLLATDGPILLAWLASGAGAGAMLLLPLFRRRKSDSSAFSATRSSVGPLVWFTTATALGLGAFSLLGLGLGLVAWLNRISAIAMLGAGIIAGIAFLSLHRRGEATAANAVSHASWVEALRAWWRAPAGWGWAWLVAVPFLALALVGTMVTPGLLWKPHEPHGYDVVAYHLQIPREWYEAGRIVPLEHNVFSYFPLAVEVHYLLAMHLTGGPWAGMYLAQLMHLALVVLSVAAACGFASRLGGTGSILAGVAAAAVPWLTQLAAVAYNEGGFLLYSTLSIGWAVWAILHPGRKLTHFFLAGAMAGLACGTKLTAVPLVLLGVSAVSAAVMLQIRLSRFIGSREKSKGTGETEDRPGLPPVTWRDFLGPVVFVVAGLLLFAPWLVRTAAWAGNPVFPEAASVLGKAHFSDGQVRRWKRAHAAPHQHTALLRFVPVTQILPDGEVVDTGRREAHGRLVEGWRQIFASWQFGYVLIPLGLAALVASRRTAANLFVAGLLPLVAVFWLGFTHLQGRFFILAVPLCVLSVAQLRWERWLMPLGLAVIVLGAVPGWLHLHRYMVNTLYAGEGDERLVTAVANGDVTWLTGFSTEGMPPGAALVLVGDAKAFWYRTPDPVGRVYYRSVFDVDAGNHKKLSQAYMEGVPPEDQQWLLIDPGELERFMRTYQPFPPAPPEWAGRPEWKRGLPFLMRGAPTPPTTQPE